jgi:hypothetical protein
MSAAAEKRDVVRLADPTELAVAVPHLLGFHPTNSLVAIALRGQRLRLSFTMRMDLVDEAHDDRVADEVATRLQHTRPQAVLLFVFVDAVELDRDLPRRALVDSIAARLRVPLRDALAVCGDRVWSYRCDDVACCPPEGRLMRPDSAGALSLAAASAIRGNAVLADRDALMATAAPVGGVTAAGLQQAFGRVAARLDPLDVVDAASSGAFLDELLRRYSEPPAALSHDEAAELALRLHAWPFRDQLLGRVARGDDVAMSIVADLVKLAQPPWDAPAAAVFAMASYLRGDGALAVAAAERAAATDPDYSLARLVLDAVDGQVDPVHARRVWARAAPAGR